MYTYPNVGHPLVVVDLTQLQSMVFSFSNNIKNGNFEFFPGLPKEERGSPKLTYIYVSNVKIMIKIKNGLSIGTLIPEGWGDCFL